MYGYSDGSIDKEIIHDKVNSAKGLCTLTN